MSTPGLWQQGDEKAALAWLANLDTRQQQALQRSIRTHQALGPIYNAVSRAVQVGRWVAARLSEYAQRLAAGARDLRQNLGNRSAQASGNQNQPGRISQLRDRAGELSDQAAEMLGRARDGVSNAAEWSANAAQGAAQRAVAGMNTAREAVVDTGRQVITAGREAVEAGREAVVNAGRQVVATGREAANRASRWFNQQVSGAALKASATFAGIAARRHDPNLQGPDLKLPTNLELAQHFAKVAAAQTPEQLAAAEADLGKFIDGKRQQLESSQAGVKSAQDMAWVLQGSPSAREAVAKKPEVTGQQQGEQGNQPGGRHRKPEGPEAGR